MTDKQKIDFNQLQSMFFERMSKYPDDKEGLAKMMDIFYGWIDAQVDAELSRVLGANSTLLRNGALKGGKA